MEKSKRFRELYAQFEKEYDLSTINSANDAANLELFITNTILIEQWQEKVLTLTDEDALENIGAIKKLSDGIRDTIETSQKLERQLGIDRKSRKRDSSVSASEYIMHLQNAANDFLNQRLTKVYCPDCQVMVMRFSAVHEHTAFQVSCQCSQCGKIVSAARQERDVFFDLKENDRKWRKAFPVEIKRPRKNKKQNDDSMEIEPDIIIDDETEDGE